MIDPAHRSRWRRPARRGVRRGYADLGRLRHRRGWRSSAVAAEAYGCGPWRCCLVNRLADGLDGAVARQTRLTDLGGFLDIVLDFIVYAGMVFAFALADPAANALAAAFLLFAFMGTGSSFLAFAIMAAKRGITTDLRGRKSLYYLGGLAEGTETILFLALACLLPDRFVPLALGFAVYVLDHHDRACDRGHSTAARKFGPCCLNRCRPSRHKVCDAHRRTGAGSWP